MPAPDALRAALRNAECFAGLDEAAMRLIEEHTRLVPIAPGQVICAEGDPGDSLYIVASGQVRALKRNEAGQPVELRVLQPGELAGVTSLFESSLRSATLQACGPVELWVLDYVTFRHLLEEHEPVAHGLLTYLSRKLRAKDLIIAQLRSADLDPRFPVAVFDSKKYMQRLFEEHNRERFALRFFDARLGPDTVALAAGFRAVCAFVNDDLRAPVLRRLKDLGVELVALRCAGFNNVDLAEAARLDLPVTRVPAYSPYAVAEHAVGLMLALNRQIHRAYGRVREGNFSLDGLVGFDMHGKTAGVAGTGLIGRCVVSILLGFGCRVLAFDRVANPELAARPGVTYAPLETLFAESDILTLHVPLLPETRHLIHAESLARMKRGVMLINTSRGGLVDTTALIEGLKSGHVGSAGLDVYEEESGYFFEDHSVEIITDDVLARLLTFPNVIVTSHQAFLTREALGNIAGTTLESIAAYAAGKRGAEVPNVVSLAKAP